MMIKQLLVDMKPLRIMLNGFAIILIALRPEVGAAFSYEGWSLVTTVLCPVLAPIIFMLLMLDSLMSKVFMVDKPADERARLSRVLRVNLIIGVALLLYWLPYFYYLNL
jgi:hypothetical protein